MKRLLAWLRTFRPCDCCGIRSDDEVPGRALCALCMAGCLGDH